MENLARTGVGVGLLAKSSGRRAVLVSKRVELGADDEVDWSVLGEPFVHQTCTFRVVSAKGRHLRIVVPSPAVGTSPPFMFRNGPAIPTNFADGECILFTGLDFSNQQGNPGPLTVCFDVPVVGGGAQLLPDIGGPFRGCIEAFDRRGCRLGSFSLDGAVSMERDGSAPFFGIVSATANIAALVFSTSAPRVGLGINRLSLRTAPGLFGKSR